MSKNINYKKLDRTIKQKTVLITGVHNLSQILYYGVCPYCGEHVEWEYQPDADGSSYYGVCYCEDMDDYYFSAEVVAVKISVEEKD